MIAVAAVAVVLNTASSMSLHKGRDDLNVRSGYLHMVGDAVPAGGVVIAGIIVHLIGAHRADRVVSVLIGLLILWSSCGILRECLTVLLEGVPADVNVDAIEAAVKAIPNVGDVHHLHAWTISSGFLACSCHVVPVVPGVEEQQKFSRMCSVSLNGNSIFITLRFRSSRLAVRALTVPAGPSHQLRNKLPGSKACEFVPPLADTLLGEAKRTTDSRSQTWAVIHAFRSP
jgi:Co/Zn/Cd efflux system component